MSYQIITIQTKCKIQNYCTMKRITNFKKSSVIILSLLCLLVCYACSDDTPEVYKVRVHIEANTNEPVRIYGLKDSSPEKGLVIRSSYNKIYKTEDNGLSIEARCNDESTLINIKVWVNGKLKADVSGNKYLTSGYIRFDK